MSEGSMLKRQGRTHIPLEVMHLFLGPQSNNLAWVLLSKSVLETVVILDVPVPVLELIECRLEDLDGTLWGDGLAFHTVHVCVCIR